MAYNLETILSEKIETIISRNIVNTRPRDFYDIYILYKLKGNECNMAILGKALNITAEKRGSKKLLKEYESVLDNIKVNSRMIRFWENYQKDFDYAKDITFSDACDTITRLMNQLDI